MRFHTAGAMLALILTAAPAHAQNPAASDNGALTILEENDLFFNQDHHYTNGTGIAYTTSPLAPDDIGSDVASDLPLFLDRGRNLQTRATYELAQDIFTPDDISLATPNPKDRPYAGYLYVGLGLIAKTDYRMDQVQLQLGVIGPASLAEDAQKLVHSVLNDQKPMGWSHQLRDEPGIEINYQRAWRTPIVRLLGGFGMDMAPHVGFAIGNVYDYASAGFMVRAGFALPKDFGPIRLDPSPPGSNFFTPTAPFSFYTFGGFEARAVERNIFLDGNTWQPTPHVDKNVLVGDLLIGAAIETEGCRIAFTHVFRSKEFKTQKSTDQFGAVTLSVAL